MYGVELYAAVRLAVVEEGLSHREAGRRFGIDRRTVKKMLSYSAPPGYRRSKPIRRPKLEGFSRTRYKMGNPCAIAAGARLAYGARLRLTESTRSSAG